MQFTHEDPYLALYKRSLLAAHVIVACSAAVSNDVSKFIKRNPNAVIPNGVDTDFFDPAMPGDRRFNDLMIKEPFALFLGTPTQRKRPDIFIDIAKTMPGMCFVIAGEGHTQNEKDKLKNAMRCVPNIMYIGGQPRWVVRSLLSRSAVLVFPSEAEGMPLAALEAMAMGIPILAQPKTSMPEIVKNRVTGWLLPGDDIAAWKRQIEIILAWSHEEKRSFAETTRNVVLENYTWHHYARRYNEVYERYRD